MDENTQDVVVLVGKRVLVEVKNEFKQFIECSPLYIALALSGLLWASWLGLVLVFIAYLAYTAYYEYKEVELDILFDVESAKRDAATAEPTKEANAEFEEGKLKDEQK